MKRIGSKQRGRNAGQRSGRMDGAAKYERAEARQGYGAGHYSRKPMTTSGGVRMVCLGKND